MELNEALSQIAEIRGQLQQARVFRGYRSATTAFSGLVALVTAALQPAWAGDPRGGLVPYLLLWGGAALLCIVVVGATMAVRCVRIDSALQQQITLLALQQFLPCLAAGALLTFVVARFAPESAWMLPGLWAILFSLGVFASRTLLPRPVVAVAGYYLLAGLLCLAVGHGDAAFSPWAMGLTFGLGQFLAAGVLYLTLERRRVGK